VDINLDLTTMNKTPVIDALQQAVKGLLYISESEAPLEPILWGPGELAPKRLLELAGATKGTAVEEETVDDFFHAVSAEDRPKFDKLAKVLKEQLAGVKVYKLGDEAEKTVYVVGKTPDGQWAGVKTSVVET
jgi:Nuclease A inhibitor-like protein